MDGFVIVGFSVFVLHIGESRFVRGGFAQQLLICRLCLAIVVEFIEVDASQFFEDATADFGQIGPFCVFEHVFHQLDEVVPILCTHEAARFFAIGGIVAQTLFLSQFWRNRFDFESRRIVDGQLRVVVIGNIGIGRGIVVEIVDIVVGLGRHDSFGLDGDFGHQEHGVVVIFGRRGNVALL